MIQFTTQPLSAERVIQAFPLIQTALPEVTLAAWRDFAAALMSCRKTRRGTWEGGILAVTDGRGTISGLCGYRVVPDLVHGRLLDAAPFLAFDLFDRRPVAEALAEAIEALAWRRACSAVHTHLPPGSGAPPDPDNGLSRLLAARGHRVETLGLCKRLVA